MSLINNNPQSTPPCMSLKLKDHLYKSYGGFADKRIKNLSKGNHFIIDDRDPMEANSGGNYNMSHCFIFVFGVHDEQIKLRLQGNIPVNKLLTEFVNAAGGKLEPSNYQHYLEVEVSARNTAFVRTLAKKIAAITALGAPRYSEPSWKYSAPRIANNLNHFADVLEEYIAANK